MSARDELAVGRKMIEQIMAEAQKPKSEISLEDKLKVFDRWVKLKTLEQRARSNVMGSGFDEMGVTDDEAGDF